ncbi:hypothetical protein K501DRAFT_289447 [Backusella circina FSU 941]|nr:hypothetical protein K501DRAFT_289447 [Backusella circina FSU 941]
MTATAASNNSNNGAKSGRLFGAIDITSLSQIKEEESAKEDMPDKQKKTASSDDNNEHSTKKRKLSTSMGQGSGDNNGFSVMNDKRQSNNEEQETDSDTWKCKWCFFEHEAYIQTCSICHKYRESEYVPRLLQNDITESTPSSQKGSKISLKRKHEQEVQEVHILQTGLTDKEEVLLKRNLTSAAKSGMRIVVHHDLKKFNQVTHVITSMDKDGLCKRTLKYLSSIIYGKWVVDHTWLSHSVKREQWLREQPYEVKGDQVAGKTNSPSIGRKKYEEKQPLFGDMYFYFSGDFPSKYNKKDLSQLCQSAGGTLLKRKPTTADTDLDRTIIIHPESTKAAHRWLEDFKVKDPSWVIDSVSKLSAI